MRFVSFAILAHVLLSIHVSALNRDYDRKATVLHEAPEGFHDAEGMLRHQAGRPHPHHRARLMNLAELMDPLESRHIDAIANQSALVDEVNYLRSFAVEQCREVVCSPRGKKRFSDCAESVLSADKQCRVGCQDHLTMWVLHRCYLAETFDCGGNIGPNSVVSDLQVFNREGPQTLSEFSESITNLFQSKGVNCHCCEFNDVILTKESGDSVSLWTGLLIATIGFVLV